MDVFTLLCVVSVMFTGLTEGAGLLPDGPLNAAVGQAVMFNITGTPPDKPYSSVGWNFFAKNIITIAGETPTIGAEYEGRVALFTSNASLELRNLTLNDTGEYSVVIFTNVFHQGTTKLAVYEPASDPKTTVSSTDLVEFNSSVRLSCSSSGSSLSFLWLNDSSEVTGSDRVELTDEGANLTITNVTRYDQGPFMCRAFNPVSSVTSDPINLNISYGPDKNINLTISPSKEYHAEGSDVTLSCSAESRPAAQFYWFLNGSQPSGSGPELKLTNIQTSQSGNYSCQAFNSKTLRYETSQPAAVTVLARISNVVITSNTSDLVEFNSSVRLSCSASGSFPSFFWLNGSSEVTGSDRVQLSDGNSTLTITNVTRYDQGPFRCRAFNPVSTDTSSTTNLSISYGPENINLTISPSQQHYGNGSNISLLCSVVSSPSAQFYWFLNGGVVAETGPELRLMNIQMSQSGNYSCQAFNNKTLRYETSQPSVVSVLERISGASITPSTNMPIEGKNVTLTCDAGGSIFTRKWMKDGTDLTLTDGTTLQDNGRVLSFKNLNKKDTGTYSCKISNPIDFEEAQYNITVNYGPDNVQIKGPDEIGLGQTITLTCSAESTPSANYTWTLNGTKIHDSPEYTKTSSDPSDSGDYTCEATNDITKKTSSAVRRLTVKAVIPGKLGFPVGGIVGIVLGLIVVICLAAAAAWYFIKKKKKIPKSSSTTRGGGDGQDNTAYAGNQELNYADVSFFRNKNGSRVQLGTQDVASDYAEVRVNSNRPGALSPPTYDAHLQRMKRQAPQPGVYGAEDYAQVRKN